MITWDALAKVLARFDALAPFGPDVPVWKVSRDSDGKPLTAVMNRRKRYAIGVRNGESVHLVDATEHVLGGVFVDPPELAGREADGRHRWTREVATRLIAEATGGTPGPLLPEAAGRFPALRRFQISSPAALAELPRTLGVRPFGLYVEGLADPLYGNPVTPRALDPGGDLSDWRDLTWCGPDGTALPVATQPEAGAVALWTLESRAIRWATPRREPPPVPVLVVPELIRKVGRLGVLVEAATVDPFADHEGLRVIYDEGDQPGFIAREIKRRGASSFARRFDVPDRTADRLAAGGRPNKTTSRRVLARLNRAPAKTCARSGCVKPVDRPNAKFCGKAHRDAAYRARRKARVGKGHPGQVPDPVADQVCADCGAVLLGAAVVGPCPVCSNDGAVAR